MARFEASQAGDMVGYTVVFGTFTEQTATRMVLAQAGPVDSTLIFTGSFTYEDPDPVTGPGELPDGFDPGNLPDGFDPGDFAIPDEFQDLLDQFDQIPDIGDFENYDVWGTLTGVELVQDGTSAWTATGMAVPLGDDEDEFGLIDLPGIFNAGFSGADRISGSNFDDWLRGYSGNDTMTGDQGDDVLEGGGGEDTAIFSGNQDSYTLSLIPSGMTLEDRREDGNGTDLVSDIEFLDFDTGDLNLSQFGGATTLSQEEFQSFIELYIALFNRAPDAKGLNFWGTAFANGTSLEEMTTLFFDQDETRALYPDTFTNAEFVETVYDNVLGRQYDQSGFDFWVPVLDDESNGIGRDSFIFSFLGGVQPNTPDEAYLQDKIDIGAYFAVHKGLSDVQDASAVMQMFDGSPESINEAVAAIDGHYADASDPDNGEFLMKVVGVLDDPFAGV